MLTESTEGIFDEDHRDIYYETNKDVLGLSLAEFNRLTAFDHWQVSINETVFFSRPFKISSPYWFLQSVEEIFIKEVYKFNTPNPQPVIIDCGANWGLSIIYFKRRFPAAVIYAYEADDEIFKLAAQNLAAFEFRDVSLFNKAIWNSNSRLVFSSEGSVGGSVTDLKINPSIDDYADAPPDTWIGNYNTYFGVHKTTEKEVEAIRLKDILKQYTAIDFLKIDIEGAEHKVIMDCAKELRRVNQMFVEYHSSPGHPQVLDEILKAIGKSGFRYYIKEAANNYTHPFIREKEMLYDLQLNIFCYR
ncbi:MAG: FkbM family methyltransferase [Ferruginibacter sp.]